MLVSMNRDRYSIGLNERVFFSKKFPFIEFEPFIKAHRILYSNEFDEIYEVKEFRKRIISIRKFSNYFLYIFLAAIFLLVFVPALIMATVDFFR